jgi:hypothetical protein
MTSPNMQTASTFAAIASDRQPMHLSFHSGVTLAPAHSVTQCADPSIARAPRHVSALVSPVEISTRWFAHRLMSSVISKLPLDNGFESV